MRPGRPWSGPERPGRWRRGSGRRSAWRRASATIWPHRAFQVVGGIAFVGWLGPGPQQSPHVRGDRLGHGTMNDPDPTSESIASSAAASWHSFASRRAERIRSSRSPRRDMRRSVTSGADGRGKVRGVGSQARGNPDSSVTPRTGREPHRFALDSLRRLTPFLAERLVHLASDCRGD